LVCINGKKAFIIEIGIIFSLLVVLVACLETSLMKIYEANAFSFSLIAHSAVVPKQEHPLLDYQFCHLNISYCNFTQTMKDGQAFIITLYNPLPRDRTENNFFFTNASSPLDPLPSYQLYF